MSDLTPRLSLPFILPAQAQKHVTHNEALLGLDALVQLTILATRQAPPETVAEGACYLVDDDPADAWLGRAGEVAAFHDGAWSFFKPVLGWRGYFAADEQMRIFDGMVWQDQPLPPDARFARLGVNATADSSNRLAVAASETLFNHEGGSHRLKINRASGADTASLLFQSNWQGRAEMGLAGTEGFTVKVSGDGSNWTTGLSIGTDGIARTESRPAALAGRIGADHAPTPGSLTGFDALFVERGGFVLGAALSGGGNRLVVPTNGLYLVALSASVMSSTGYQLSLLKNGAETVAVLGGQPAAGAPDIRSRLAFAMLAAGDWLAFGHSGDAILRFGSDGTTISIALI